MWHCEIHNTIGDKEPCWDCQDEIDKLRVIVKAVAHIGIDFGYGTYELEEKYITQARELVEQIECNE